MQIKNIDGNPISSSQSGEKGSEGIEKIQANNL